MRSTEDPRSRSSSAVTTRCTEVSSHAGSGDSSQRKTRHLGAVRHEAEIVTYPRRMTTPEAPAPRACAGCSSGSRSPSRRSPSWPDPATMGACRRAPRDRGRAGARSLPALAVPDDASGCSCSATRGPTGRPRPTDPGVRVPSGRPPRLARRGRRCPRQRLPQAGDRRRCLRRAHRRPRPEADPDLVIVQGSINDRLRYDAGYREAVAAAWDTLEAIYPAAPSSSSAPRPRCCRWSEHRVAWTATSPRSPPPAGGHTSRRSATHGSREENYLDIIDIGLRSGLRHRPTPGTPIWRSGWLPRSPPDEGATVTAEAPADAP